MRRTVLLLGPLFTLAACPSDPANPATLWLSTANQMETKVKLIDHEPTPF